MTSDELRDAIASQIRVARADVVAAKAHLLTLATDERIDVSAESREWARLAAPGAPGHLTPDREGAQDQTRLVARYLSARLACCAAVWELVHSGLMFHTGDVSGESPSWDVTIGGYSFGVKWGHRFDMFFPQVVRPAWHLTRSELFDSDLYLQRFSGSRLHPAVEEALKLSLACFQRDLYVPSVAMLGAASEGAWIEMGLSLARRFPSEAHAGRLRNTLDDSRASTNEKIKQICHFYERPDCVRLHSVSGVDGRRLRQIQQWSDQIREARNVLHWGATPSVPNTYEKVAILLMDAVSELTDLQRVTNSQVKDGQAE